MDNGFDLQLPVLASSTSALRAVDVQRHCLTLCKLSVNLRSWIVSAVLVLCTPTVNVCFTGHCNAWLLQVAARKPCVSPGA
jgi:hypothetical protein